LFNQKNKNQKNKIEKEKEKEKNDKALTRKDFIKGAAAVGAVAGVQGCSSLITKEPSKKENREPDSVETEYDFIVVGTGAGGAPLASRLALKGFSVLCIEAGFDHTEKNGDDPVEMKVPIYHGNSSEDPEWSWNFFVRHNSKNKKNILGQTAPDLRDTKFEKSKGGILYPRASAVGGCTTHNAMITMYPDNKDWTHLENLSGDKSWSSENMRSYFKKMENNLYDGGLFRNNAYGFRGWLSTSQSKIQFLLDDLFGNPFKEEDFIKNPFARIALANALAWKEKYVNELRGTNSIGDKLSRAFIDRLKAVVAIGKKRFLDLDPNAVTSGAKKDGLVRVVAAIDENGKRSGPKDFLLKSKKQTGRIEIVTGHLASKVLFKEDGETISGVECIVSKETNLYKASPNHEKFTTQEIKVYKAKKEVILAGGAFNSPQLLMLSGIGSEEHLVKKGIRPRINLPMVGQNLQDRYEIGVVTELDSDFEVLKDCTFEPQKDPCLDEYLRDPKNSLYGTNGVLIGNLVNSRHSKASEDPDLFVFGIPGDFRGYMTGYSVESAKYRNRLTWAVLKAKSSNTSGTVKLKSADPTDTPEINFNFFTDGKEDLETVVDGINFSRLINKQSPLSSLTKKELWPGKEVKGQKKLESFVAREAWGHHASCTCPMGRYSTDSVVDFNFKVHGTKNLRIVDASVFPKIPGHFIVTPIYMISEKAADVIAEDYRL